MKLARKEILKVKPYIPGKPIEEVKRELGLLEVIKLASNENAFAPPAGALRAAKRALLTVNRYPDGGCFYLKKALAGHLGVRPENIIVGNGSDEIIILALRAFLKRGEEAIIARPTFLIYGLASQIAGAKIKFAPLKDSRYDIPGMVRLISGKTKFIFIANPDNPTGTYITRSEVDFLVSRAPKNTILYFDEAYFEFAKNIRDFPNTMKYLKSKNIIITRSFSKIYSLAGLRVGYGIAKREIIDCLDRVREPFNVNSVAQAAARVCLRDKTYVEKTVRFVEKAKAFLCKELDSLGLEYIPSVTNFVLVNINKDSKKVYRGLLKRGIIVREMSPWKFKNFIRVTVGTMRENRKFIKALREVL